MLKHCNLDSLLAIVKTLAQSVEGLTGLKSLRDGRPSRPLRLALITFHGWCKKRKKICPLIVFLTLSSRASDPEEKLNTVMTHLLSFEHVPVSVSIYSSSQHLQLVVASSVSTPGAFRYIGAVAS